MMGPFHVAARKTSKWLYVEGSMSVAHPGLDPVLSLDPTVRTPGVRALTLALQNQYADAVRVVTEKPICHREPRIEGIHTVEIRCDGVLLASVAIG